MMKKMKKVLSVRVYWIVVIVTGNSSGSGFENVGKAEVGGC